MAKAEQRESVLGFLWRHLKRIGPRRHQDVKRFDEDLKNAGDLQGTAEKGVRSVDVNKVVGSVGRWKNLRSDFFYKHGKAITKRFIRIGEAMKQGRVLPAIDVYKIGRRRKGDTAKSGPSRYYVVDGHHRVAMAKKLGQDFLDAHVVEYKVEEKEKTKKSELSPSPDSDECRGQRSAEPPKDASTDGPVDTNQSSPQK